MLELVFGGFNFNSRGIGRFCVMCDNIMRFFFRCEGGEGFCSLIGMDYKFSERESNFGVFIEGFVGKVVFERFWKLENNSG